MPFLVSRVHEFESKNIIVLKPGYSGFKIDDKAFSSVQQACAKDIRDALITSFPLHDLVFNMATSRCFVFEVFYEGVFRVGCNFSDEYIESEGGVRDALVSFFEEVSASIEPFGFEVISTPSSHRRSSRGEYVFGVYYAPHISFNERDVHGEGCYAIRGDASIEEVNEFGVDFSDTLVEETNVFLALTLEENLPFNANLISSEIGYVDDSAEVYEVDDELTLHLRK